MAGIDRFDRDQLADFLRRRREALQPEDVGFPRGPRRRTGGLRREEVAMLASMSTDYLSRLEQRRGPQPSESMLAAIARALRLTIAERDHLFRLAGHTPPAGDHRFDHVSPALLRVLDRLDTPAMVRNDLAESLAQNPLAVALLGDESRYAPDDLRRSQFLRWFTDPDERALRPVDEHEHTSRAYVSNLRLALGRRPDDTRTLAIIDALEAASEEFKAIWEEHDVSWRPGATGKTILHPRVGPIACQCQVLVDPVDGQMLLVYTVEPGSPSADALRLLEVVGGRELDDLMVER